MKPLARWWRAALATTVALAGPVASALLVTGILGPLAQARAPELVLTQDGRRAVTITTATIVERAGTNRDGTPRLRLLGLVAESALKEAAQPWASPTRDELTGEAPLYTDRYRTSARLLLGARVVLLDRRADQGFRRVAVYADVAGDQVRSLWVGPEWDLHAAAGARLVTVAVVAAALVGGAVSIGLLIVCARRLKRAGRGSEELWSGVSMLAAVIVLAGAVPAVVAVRALPAHWVIAGIGVIDLALTALLALAAQVLRR